MYEQQAKINGISTIKIKIVGSKYTGTPLGYNHHFSFSRFLPDSKDTPQLEVDTAMDQVSSFFESILTVESGAQGEGKGGAKSGESHEGTEENTKSTEGSQDTSSHRLSTSSGRSIFGRTNSGSGNSESGAAVGANAAGAIASPNAAKRRDSFDFGFWSSKKDDSEKKSAPSPSAASTFYASLGIGGGSGSGSGNASSSLLGDKLMEKMISMILPLDASTTEGQSALKERIAMQKSRPSLSVNIMSKNSIQLVQRLSVPFQLLDQIIIFFSWYNPTFTIALLLFATHIILQPILLTVLPIAYVLFTVMVPHYLSVYPPDRSIIWAQKPFFEYNPVPSDDRLDKPSIPSPIPEFSREFILNLTDLQNFMMIYVIGFDWVMWLTKDYLYFKDETISTIVYLGLIGILFNNLYVLPRVIPVVWPFIPIRFILISNIWIGTILFHPYLRNRILEWVYDEDTRLWFLTISNKVEARICKLFGIPTSESGAIEDDESDDIPGSLSEVEIFEIQRLDMRTKVWEPIGYSPDFYTLNNSYRLMSESIFDDENEEQDSGSINHEGDGTSGTKSNSKEVKTNIPPLEDISHESIEVGTLTDTQTYNETLERDYKIPRSKYLESVKPPIDWQFSTESWKLDLDSSEWVAQNFIQDIVWVDTDEKWVYDASAIEDVGQDEEKGQDRRNSNESTNAKDDLNREIFRRRRWIRKCSRQNRILNAGSKTKDSGEPKGHQLIFECLT